MKGMKKVLIFSLTYYPNFFGGAEVAIKEITDRLDPQEYSFDMITLRIEKKLPKFEKIGNVNIYRIGMVSNSVNNNRKLPYYLHLSKYFYIPLAIFKAWKLNRLNRYNMIWSMMATYNSFAAIIFKLLNPKIKYILTLQEGDPIEYLKRRALPLYPLFKMIFTKADIIQVISHFLGDWAKDMGAKCPIVVIPNGVNFKLFNTRDENKINEIRKIYRKDPNDILLITTSRLVFKNAIDDVIYSLKYLPANVKFLILGQGPLKPQYDKIIQEEKLGDRIYFIGQVAYKDMPPYLHACDIFVRPSLSEGFGNSFIEAMAASIPVIATPVGGIVDFVKDRITGLMVNVKDPADIARKVKMLIHDKNMTTSIVKNSLEMVGEKYDWDYITSDMKRDVLV